MLSLRVWVSRDMVWGLGLLKDSLRDFWVLVFFRAFRVLFYMQCDFDFHSTRVQGFGFSIKGFRV